MKSERTYKQDSSAVKVWVFVITGVFLTILAIICVIAYNDPNIDFLTTISSTGTVFTAILTALYVYTTTQQISIANKQLLEMKNDRINQEQPLVILEGEEFEVRVPKMYYSPPDNEYSYRSQFYYYAKIKNVSSFSAISIDITSELMIMTEDGKALLKSLSKRIKFLGPNQSEDIDFLFLEQGKIGVYDALRQIRTAELPKIKTTIVYRNLCGAYFKTENYTTVFPLQENLNKLVVWHTDIVTASVANKEIIASLKTMNINDPKREEIFDNMKNTFNENFENEDNITIECQDDSLDFVFSLISKDDFDRIVSMHGYPRRIRGFNDCIDFTK